MGCYRDAGEPESSIIIVDRDCFYPWKCDVRLDVHHFMQRSTQGLTTEDHALYGTFCLKFSRCIFEWDEHEIKQFRKAKGGELKK